MRIVFQRVFRRDQQIFQQKISLHRIFLSDFHQTNATVDSFWYKHFFQSIGNFRTKPDEFVFILVLFLIKNEAVFIGAEKLTLIVGIS